MTWTVDLADGAARDRIRDALDETLFVEAGAGSGKTTCLVDRLVATVLYGGVPMRHIAAVTFTEKAGAELRDRLRAAFEQAARDPATRDQAEEALDDLDGAAIGTLHSFAQRILTEHPIEAGLPPLIEVLDEVASSVAFEERWAEECRELLDTDDLADPLLLGMAAGLKLEHLRSLAKAFTADWDLLPERVLGAPAPPPPTVPHLGDMVTEARRLAAMADHCTRDEDRLLPRLAELTAWAERLETAPDPAARLEVLTQLSGRKFRYGQRANWRCDLNALRAECNALVDRADQVVAETLDAALRHLARWIAEKTLAAAESRRHDGRLEFHDLLVLSRDLLRSHEHGPAVRTALQDRYRRLLLDEFQDTDPIQIELAVRIAGGAAADAPRWEDVAVPPGTLFIVGDPKQSIYRFRRADIATYLRAQQHIGVPVPLTTNFRTVSPILDWLNGVFGVLIQPAEDSQPGYRPLDAHRGDPATGPPVVVLGSVAHRERLTADQLRVREAADVAAVIRAAIAEQWQVYDDRAGQWRPVALGDIAVLVPARTSLPQLEDALEVAGVPYRTEASSLVYQAAEVRELLAAARAVDDPSDPLALVTALRSPLFGCGDDDLWTWRQAGGRFHILAPVPEAVPDDHPVRAAVDYLRRLHNDARWLAPSDVLTALVRDCRMLEVAVDSPRARDTWRRLRFVVDQARAWSEAEHGGLRGYLAWAARQGEESSRVAEAVLPETDTDAVRVMTVHAAKGLEFPVVVLSGMTSQPANARGVQVLWPPEGGFEVRVSRGVQTGDFEAAKPLDEQMDDHERRRLLYVACTRARDHLVVSLHRCEGSSTRTGSSTPTNAALLTQVWTVGDGATAFDAEQFAATPAGLAEPAHPGPPPDWAEWSERMASVRQRAATASAISASGLEGTDPAAVTVSPGLAKGARDLESPPWNKGRFGTAIGRAVHAVLQTVDLASGAGLDDAVAAQALAEGVVEYADLVRDLAAAALRSDVVRQAAEREHWKESYVGTVLDDGTVLEGFVDLIYRDHDGLVIVDYKTDAVPVPLIDARVGVYRPQLAAYVRALEDAYGQPVTGAVLLFLTPEAALERRLPPAMLDHSPHA